ncbi:permease, partial [Adlercreutzia sp.]
ETMIPIAGILMDKGVSAGIVIALILGGAGASIPEVSLLNSIFKKQMVVTFVLCIFLVAVGTGFAFTLFSL